MNGARQLATAARQTRSGIQPSEVVSTGAGSRRNLRSNHLLQAQLRGVQAKTAISQPGDSLEREADRVADSVMRAPHSPVRVESSSGVTPAVQRMCSACEEEIHRKAATGPSAAVREFRHPQGTGRPLPGAERRFFESRFHHHFGDVRVHTGREASAAARSVSALAYTKGNDIVFGENQYRPGTESGRRLVAHELTHVLQQRAGASQAVQRLGDPSQAPSMTCPVATTSAQFVDTNVLFPLGSATLDAAGITAIAAFLGRWNAAGANKPVRIDGYASTDGTQRRNWTLSCDRASIVEAELSTPSSGATGIPANLIQVFAQGETSEFGAALDQNRRATIAADVAPPAPCANPGVQRSIDLQPVFLRTGPADAAPTGTSWRRRFDEANRIWGKLAVTFNELTPVTIDTPLKTTGNDLVERDAIAALRTGTAVQVFIVDNDMAFAGGAWTRPPGGAPLCEGNVVMTDRGTSDTLLAHELTHTMGIDHPGTGGTHDGEAGTITEPSGSMDVDNSRRNTMVNFNAIQCPAGTASICLNPDP